MKKFSAIMVTHLVLMVLMILGTIGGEVNFIVGAINSTTTTEKLSNVFNLVLMLVILAMLVMGALYLLKRYVKQASLFYKLFFAFNIIVCVLTIVIDLCFYNVNALLIVICVLNAFKIISLCVLVFGKDLGEDMTWLFLYIILALDFIGLVLAIANMSGVGFDFSFTGYVTALIADGTIGLAIRGKYQDKASRGSK